ncbi:MAG: tRNA pseudouridine(55) synthase TruB [Armatimonadetes bacterium]|nr:tRNA pseudouridine(55) synthase TruB [Armatimonadota bacterium]
MSALTDGFLNILKPPGMTSHDVVAWARRLLGLRRIGHLGTLDPAAAGVLPLSVGRATRLFEFAGGGRKSYRAEIVFGCHTDTLDAEGRIMAEASAAHLTAGEVRARLIDFVGEMEQTPPAFSAAKVNGRPLHRQARAGELQHGRPKQITIYSLDLVSFETGTQARALVDVSCSTGTYVRVLADELGKAAGPGAYLGFLVRMKAGAFDLSEAHTVEEMEAAKEEGRVGELLLAPDWPLATFPEITLNAAQEKSFINGSAVCAGMADAWPVRSYGPRRRFLGLGEVVSGGLRPRVVLAGEDTDKT